MKKILYWASIFALAMTMAACGDDKKETPPTPPIPPVGGEVVELEGNIDEDMELDAENEYLIVNSVNVKNGATLTIPAGTVIKAEKGFEHYILVEMGGKIDILGTAGKPVLMTSNADKPEAGDWGGLIINGKARLTGGATGTTEISSTVSYGGTEDGDDSGSINYLILEYTGAQDPLDDDVEHNGLTLNAVGRKTTIKDVFVVNGADDGIEFFGGTVSVENLLVVNPDDDMFDFTYGYSGTLKNAYGIYEESFNTGEKDPSGIEADGNLDGFSPTADLQSDFVVENLTIDLRNEYNDDTAASPKRYMQNAFRIRRGTTATITNALVKGTGFVQNFINMTASESNGDFDTVMSVTNELEGDVEALFLPAGGEATYPGIKIEAGNKGCPDDIFDWTGYNM